MGFQTTLMILNDNLHEIDNDPKGWWETTREKILRHTGIQKPQSYGFGSSSNGFSIVSVHHADLTTVLAVGGNDCDVLSQHYNQGFHDDKTKLELLKKLAGELGYNVSKKRSPK